MYSKTSRNREVITFRRFSRKKYALFSVLKKEVRIGVLSVATLASAAPCLAQTSAPVGGQESEQLSADTLRMSEATVTALRAVSKVTEVSAVQMHVLTREDLAQAGVTTVNDLLKTAAGVDVRQRGSFGMQTDISIDGGTFDQIAFFVNGFPVNNPQTGHNAADFLVNVSDIERVEVLAGAGSSIFGSQAFSGAVNVVTKEAADVRHSASSPFYAYLAGGSYGTVLAEARIKGEKRLFSDSADKTAGAEKPLLGSTLSASFRRSDGAVQNGDFRAGKAFWQGWYDDASLNLQMQAAASLNGFGANTFYSAAYPNQWEATSRYHAAARAVTKGRVRLIPEVSWLRNVDHFQLIRDTHTAENFHRGDVFTAAARATTDFRLSPALWSNLTLGAELRAEEIFSTNLGRPLSADERFRVRGEDGIFYDHHDARTNIAFTLSDELQWRGLSVALRLLMQRNTSTGRSFRFYPGLNLAYRLQTAAGCRWQWFASWNKSLRLPTFTDLYYKSPTQEGNTGLRAEENSAFRLGMKFDARPLSLEMAAFYNHGRNMIDWVMYSAEDIYHATNFRLNNMGVSGAATLHLQEILGNRQPLRSLSLSYAYIHQQRKDALPVFKSNYALEYLRHKFTLALSHRILQPLEANWTLRWWQREGSYFVYESGQSTGLLRPYGNHALLDVKLIWKGTAKRRFNYEIFAEADNITATRYYDLGNVRQPGRTFLVGTALTW